MDMARIQPAEAGPTPKPDDLAAYDVILGNARRLTFRMVQHVHQGKVTTFRVDADGTKDAFSILVNHDRARPGENLANNEPFGAFVADVVLGDGSDNRVVQTITCSGQMDWKEFMYNKKSCPPVQSMDRGDQLTLTSGSPGGATGACGCPKCDKEIEYKVERSSGASTRLFASKERNEAQCRRAWCDCLCWIPFFACGGPICLNVCCAHPDWHYELQDASNAPLGGASFTHKQFTCCYNECCAKNQPHKSFADLGSAPLAARRDLVASVAMRIGSILATPATG